MPALAPYIPAKDAALATWAANFATLIAASPATYGLQASDATTITAAQTTFAAAYALVTSPTTKSASTVAAKDTAKVSMLAVIRPYAQTISLNAGVSSANKIALGVNPRTSTPVPITAPTTSPTLTVVTAPPLQHVIRFRDSTASPSVKAKPYGVVQMQLFGMVSATAVTDPSTLPLVNVFTKSPSLVTWPSSAKGMTAYYAARWVTRKGLTGPWSAILSYTVAG